MHVAIKPNQKDILSDLAKSVTIPPSKSVSHRAIICACLAKGKSTVRNLEYSNDIKTTIAGMRQLGAEITEYSDYVEIDGSNTFVNISPCTINCKDSGSSLRFFIPLFSLTQKTITFVGENLLLKRPQAVYKEIFERQSLSFVQSENSITIDGALTFGKYVIRGDVSSQFITGLLFILPMLNGNSEIIVTPPFESRSYIDLTLQVMNDFGVKAEFTDEFTLKIRGGQRYIPCDYTVEGDFSQLAFFAVMGAIPNKHSKNGISCYGLRHNSLQGDKVIIDILKKYGAKIDEIDGGYHITPNHLNACDIDLSDCPDLGPILIVLAAFSNGITNIYNAGRLRLKESDRINTMKTELEKLGVTITSLNDTIIINGNSVIPLASSKDINLYAHNDHRIAMSLSITGICLNTPIIIDGAECIKKSYPSFYQDLISLGINCEITGQFSN